MFNPHHPIVVEDIDRILAEPLPWQSLAGKHVLVTGATGMLGGYLALVMLEVCRRVVPAPRVSLLVRDSGRARERLGHAIDGLPCDLVEGRLEAPPALPAGPPDFILHAASPASPRDYAVDPIGVIRANVQGSFGLLDHYAAARAPRFLFLSSAVYGSTENDGPVGEDSFGAIPTLDPRNCYIESKRMVENLLACWQRQHGLDFRIARIFHTFGPGLNLDDGRIFSDVLSAACNRDPIVLTSAGLAQRTFCYLGDAVAALYHLLLAGQPGMACNVGNARNELSIREFAELAVQLTDPPLELRRGDNDDASYTPAATVRGHPDTTRIESLGWRPRYRVAEALERTFRSLTP